MSEYLTITAHSGCEGTVQDSLASVSNGILLGADVVEVDVRRSKDGLLVISHNHRAEYTGCVLLSDVFDAVCASKVRVNCDIKEEEIVHDVLAFAASGGIIDKHLLTLSGSVSPTLLKEYPDVARHAVVHLNIEELIKDYCMLHFPSEDIAQLAPWDVVKEYQQDLLPVLGNLVEDSFTLGIQAINLPYSGWAQQLFSKIYQMGVPVSVWTVNEQVDMEHLISGGVLNLTTLHVRKAMEVRRRFLGY